MQTTSGNKLHPVLWAAAISVIVLSLAGLGAIFGVIPTAGSKTTDTLAAAPAAADKASAPDIKSADAKTEAAADEPVKKAAPAQKPAVKHAPTKVAHSETAARADHTAAARAAPAVCRDCGVVEAVRPIEEKGEGTGLGAVAGGLVGGLLGNQIGRGNGRTVATVAGVAGGAYAGHQIEKTVRKITHYEIVVRFDDGTSRVFTQQTEPSWRSGDRVRVRNGAIVARGE